MNRKLSATLSKFIENDMDCFVALKNRRWEYVSVFSLNVGLLSKKKMPQWHERVERCICNSKRGKEPYLLCPLPTFSLSFSLSLSLSLFLSLSFSLSLSLSLFLSLSFSLSLSLSLFLFWECCDHTIVVEQEERSSGIRPLLCV